MTDEIENNEVEDEKPKKRSAKKVDAVAEARKKYQKEHKDLLKAQANFDEAKAEYYEALEVAEIDKKNDDSSRDAIKAYQKSKIQERQAQADKKAGK